MAEKSELNPEVLLAELNIYKRIAAYLAECHAATAEYEGHLKGTSRSKKDRYAAICNRAADMLAGKEMPKDRSLRTTEDEVAGAIDRCLKAAEALREEARDK